MRMEEVITKVVTCNEIPTPSSSSADHCLSFLRCLHIQTMGGRHQAIFLCHLTHVMRQKLMPRIPFETNVVGYLLVKNIFVQITWLFEFAFSSCQW